MVSKAKHTVSAKKQSKPRKKNGASRRAKKSANSQWFGGIKWFLRGLVVTGCIGGAVFAINAINISEKWHKFYQKPINEVQIDGEFLYLSYDELRASVDQALATHFLDIDLNVLKETLEQNPWIDSVSVARKWPGKLVIKVVEQQPIARWGADGFLNMRGDIIRTEHLVNLGSLPLLSGNDLYATEVMQEYLRMGKLLAQAELMLESVELDETRSWTLVVGEGVVVKLGRDSVWEKLQYLASATRTTLAQNFGNISSVDMRYSNGMAVGWKKSFAAPAIAKQ